MRCNHCSGKSLVCKGKVGIKQRFQCKTCKKYQQDIYVYKRYNSDDDIRIKVLNAEGVGIRSMSRILGYSSPTIIRRILYLASKITKPIYFESNQIYEVDELWTYVGKNCTSSYSWITYAMNRRTRCVIDVAFGSRSNKELEVGDRFD